MPEKSKWDSDVGKAIIVLSALVTASVASISFYLQYFGKVNFWHSLILPIIKFFNRPVPVYSIPLAFLIVALAVLLGLYLVAKLNPAPSNNSVSNPLAGAEFLDNSSARLMALLCKNPREADSLKQDYQYRSSCLMSAYVFDYCLKGLEKRELIIFQNQQWVITQKALDYIAKYHGDPDPELQQVLSLPPSSSFNR